MKKLVILSALMYVFNWVFATELPELNLEVGKTYIIETINHIDTSAQNPVRNWDQCKWLFTPISYNPSTQTYRMKAVLDYYQHIVQEKKNMLGWYENEVYETGYLQNYRSQMVYLNANKVPLYFDISKKGIVDSYDFSEYNKTKTPEGIDLIFYEVSAKVVGRDIQNIFFHQSISTTLKKMDDALYKYHVPERKGYRITEQDSSSVTLEIFPTKKDSMNFFMADFVSERLTLDKTTGLVLQHHFTYKSYQVDYSKANFQSDFYNLTTYYQKYIPEYTLNKKSIRMFCDGEWIDTIISKSNTLIKCKIANRIAGEDSVDILTGSFGDKCYRVPLSKNNDFVVGFTLDKSTLIRIRYPRLQWGDSNSQFRKNTEKSTFTFEAVAGDNLNLKLSIIDSFLNFISVDGIYSTVFHLEKEFWFLNEYPQCNINFTWAKEKNLPLLNEYRLKADPRIYLDKFFGITYCNEIQNLLDYREKINKIPISSRKDISIISPQERVIINNTLAKTNFPYLNFVMQYIEYVFLNQVQNIAGINLNAPKNIGEDMYYLGQALLSESVKSNYLSYYIINALSRGKWEDVNSLYESFIRNYPNSPFSKTLQKECNRYKNTLLGAYAPNFTMKDIYGKEYSLRDFKKKVVALYFYKNPWSEKGEYKQERFISKLEKNSNDSYKDLVRIFFLNGNNNELIEQIKGKAYKGIFLIENYEPELSSNVSFKYNVNNRDTEFLIDRNGRIIKKPNFWQSEIYDVDIKNALAVPYQRSYDNVPIWIRITLISLVAALLAIALTFLFYRIITKRRLQKSELNKRMRELELTAIRAQMNPHFMYNCLNSIQNLVQKNKNEEAHLYLSKFAALIRQVLNTSKKEEVSLAEELETINGYIDLEKLRFDFDFRLIIEDGIEAISLFVPPMLLQPIVENALLHGLLPKPENRTLTISIERRNHNICIAVEDNGIGREASQKNSKAGNGKGLELTRERLTLMAGKYKALYRMSIEDLSDSENCPLGTRVTICIEEE